MAISHTYATEREISLSEFMEYANKNADPKNSDSLLALGEQLSMLGNNREFLSDFMAHYIATFLERSAKYSTISQSVTIARGNGFYLRANIWLPEADMTDNEAHLYAYHQAHDHNFDLLTYAYCGSGYITETWQYDYANVSGYVGEIVDITPMGTHHHKCGEIMLYYCNKDIHIQRPPETPSITLNVIPVHNQGGLLDQYFFNIPTSDSTQGILSHYAQSNIERRRALFNLARIVGSERVSDILTQISLEYQCGRTRYEALRTLASCSEHRHLEVCKQLYSDTTPIIKHYLSTIELL